ncbi:Crp/Fnr family transcriptional regulator [Oceanithermus sp.]|uniref:Crp/Fnr family transcriptional regulator n=1 Tax=Oceanithermus sp. TaxID=2268145 RepID=UPI0025D03BC2|nr:Crp/Fnr family transcriptional regulator [Oceanithermus sp.]
MKLDAPELLQSPLFEGLPPEAREIAEQAFRTMVYRPGQTIFEAGDPGHALYLIRSGRVKISHCNLDGKEKVLAYLNPGEIFGEMSLVDEEPRSATATAVDEVTLHALYLEEYWGLVRRYPQVAHNLARILARRLREMNHEVEVLTFEEARGRIAYALLKLYRHRYGEPTARGRRMSLTHRELADLAGASRETATRVLNQFHERGLVRAESRVIEVLDVEGLENVLYDL